MASIAIETNEGERMYIKLPNGTFIGGHIINFMNGLWMYCDSDDPDMEKAEKEFFSNIMQSWGNLLCEELSTLYHQFSYYEGESLLNQSTAIDYIDIDPFMHVIEKLLSVIKDREYHANVWYKPGSTEEEFRIFLSTLAAFKNRGTRKVRFIVEL